MGATGGFVAGGACAHDVAGSSAATVKPNMQVRPNMAYSMPRVSNHKDN